MNAASQATHLRSAAAAGGSPPPATSNFPASSSPSPSLSASPPSSEAASFLDASSQPSSAPPKGADLKVLSHPPSLRSAMPLPPLLPTIPSPSPACCSASCSPRTTSASPATTPAPQTWAGQGHALCQARVGGGRSSVGRRARQTGRTRLAAYTASPRARKSTTSVVRGWTGM